MAKQVALPLAQKPYYNADSMAESIATDDMVDCYLEPVPGVGLVTRRRPALVEFTDAETSAPGDGLFWWDAKSKLIAVSGGKVFDVASDGTCTQLTAVPSAYFSADADGYLAGETSTSIVTLLLANMPPDRCAHKVSISSADFLFDSSFLISGIGNTNTIQTETVTNTAFEYPDSYDVRIINATEADGTAGTGIHDCSFSQNTITASGDAAVDASETPFLQGGAASFDGAGDYLSIPDSASWFMDAGPFTIDFFVKTGEAVNGFFGQVVDTDNYAIMYSANGYLYFKIKVSTTETVSVVSAVDWNGAVSLGDTWRHIAIIRGWGGNTNDWAITVDGAKSGATVTDSDVWPDMAASFEVGRASATYMTGKITAFRVRKGQARWTANFTPPTVPTGVLDYPFTVTSSDYFKRITSITPTITVDDFAKGLVSGATGAGPFTAFVNQPPKGFACKFYASNASADLSAIGITVAGTDIDDLAQTEVLAAGPTTTANVTGTKYFKTVTSITLASTYGANTADFGWKGGAGNAEYGGTYDFGWTAAYQVPAPAAPVSGTPVVFADGQSLDGSPWLYMASGNLVAILSSMALYSPADANTPDATHVGWINSRFVANEPGTNRFDTTDTDPATGNIENDYWSATDNPLTCEARGDLLSALFTAFLEIYAWGSDGLEIWQDDGVTPFSPVQSAFTAAGIEGPYAYGKIDNTVFALCVIEGKRCVVRLNARSPQIVSEPIARVLADMDSVSDAFCDIISAGGMSIALFSFPTDGQSWAYDYKNDTWLRWGLWNVAAGQHERFLGQHSCFAKAWNKHLIQSRVDGKIYEIDRTAYLDGSVPVVSYRRTGWVDHGTWNRKRIPQFFIKVKVYPNTTSPTPTLMIRWRDNGNPVWSNYTQVDITLNPDNQGTFIVPMNRLGIYRSRQYEFRLSDNVDLVLVGATEDVEVMRN